MYLTYLTGQLDAVNNISFAEGIYIQTSTNGVDWTNGTNFKTEWNTAASANNKIELALEGDVFVRLFVQSAGTQEGTFQLRLIVLSAEIHKMENLEEPVDVTFDPNFGEETATVFTIEAGETIAPLVLADRTGIYLLRLVLSRS